MSRKVILLDLYWTREKDPRVPLGHASLRAALAQRGEVSVQPIVLPVNRAKLSPTTLARQLIEVAAGPRDEVDLAIGTYVWAEATVRALLTEVRALGFQGRIILGGPQVSYAGPGLEAIYPEGDVFVRGSGEDALVALVATPGRRRIPGVHWARTLDRVSRAEVELEQLPSPWLTGVISLEERPFLRWETQRGCPYRCAFCQHREAGARLTRRRLANDRIVEEIALFCRSGVRDIAVLDPIFNIGERPTEIASSTFDHRDWMKMDEVSRALSATEGAHPETLAELLRLAEGLTGHDLASQTSGP